MTITASDLKYQHELHNPDSEYFRPGTMRFFGDRMSNYGVIDHGEYYELYRRKPVKHGNNKSAYFDKTTFKRIHGINQ